jgi:hypothetical protein
VNDTIVRVTGGLKCIQTLDGYIIPLWIKSGIAGLNLRPFTDEEWKSSTHAFLTSEMEWDPSILVHEFDEDDQWFDAISDLSADPSTNIFDEFGNYRKCIMVYYSNYFDCESEAPFDALINKCVDCAHDSNYPFPTASYDAFAHNIQANDESQLIAVPNFISKKISDYTQLRPLFGWIKPETIEKTLKLKMQYARRPTGTPLKKTFKSPNPILNFMRRNESGACDIVFSDNPEVADGSTAAVIFVGIYTQVTVIYGIKTDKQLRRRSKITSFNVVRQSN